jgi:hypothetical protein
MGGGSPKPRRVLGFGEGEGECTFSKREKGAQGLGIPGYPGLRINKVEPDKNLRDEESRKMVKLLEAYEF